MTEENKIYQQVMVFLDMKVLLLSKESYLTILENIEDDIGSRIECVKTELEDKDAHDLNETDHD